MSARWHKTYIGNIALELQNVIQDAVMQDFNPKKKIANIVINKYHRVENIEIFIGMIDENHKVRYMLNEAGKLHNAFTIEEKINNVWKEILHVNYNNGVIEGQSFEYISVSAYKGCEKSSIDFRLDRIFDNGVLVHFWCSLKNDDIFYSR